MFNILLLLGLFIFVLAFLIVICFLIINFVEQVQYWDTPKRMLFLPTKINSIKDHIFTIIKKYTPITSNVDLVELGCGRAGFLRMVSRELEFRSLVGIEGQYSVWIQAVALTFGSPIKIIRGDIFDYNPIPNSIIYCYLGEKLMTLLYEAKKFENCLVISLDYKISSIEFVEEVMISNSDPSSKIQKSLIVYDFRK
jgi:hypothetical protein